MRHLGMSGLEVSPFCFGGSVIRWTVSDEMAMETLDAFAAAGGNFIDTADVYSDWVPGNSGGESETVLGSWLSLRKLRHRMVIATKAGMPVGADRGGLSRAYLMRAVEGSLRRLKTDYIDLYQSHVDDTTIPMEELMETFALLLQSGKVRAIGASNISATRLRSARVVSHRMGLPSYQSLQCLYNLYDRKPFERELEQLCLAKRMGVMTYFSLASGFLSGKYRSKEDASKTSRRDLLARYLNARGFSILNALDVVSKKHNVAPATIALAWLLAKPSVTSVITSATSPSQLQEILTASQIQLDDASESLLNHVSSL